LRLPEKEHSEMNWRITVRFQKRSLNRWRRASGLGGLALPLVAAALLMAGPVLAAGSGPAWLNVPGLSAFTAATQGNNLVKLTVSTDGTIPRQADAFVNSNPVVGFAWADLDSGKVVVATIHPVLGRDSHQDPDAWHVHTATLSGGATGPNDFCVSSIDSTPTAGIAIQGNTMSISMRASDLPVALSAFDAAVGFTIQGDSACGSGLGVELRINP